MRRSLSLATAVVLASCGLAGAATWQIDPAHSSARFKVRHLAISSVTGAFGKVTGMIGYDEADVTKASIEATIDATTIDTGVEKRDEDLKSANFLDVAKYPTITFKSTKVEKAGEGRLKVTGDLTIHGVTRPVTLDVEGPMPPIKDPWGNTRTAASATTTINRQHFGVSWSKVMEGGGLMVGNEVAITIQVELVKK